jgi:hypothetical protein
LWKNSLKRKKNNIQKNSAALLRSFFLFTGAQSSKTRSPGRTDKSWKNFIQFSEVRPALCDVGDACGAKWSKNALGLEVV